MSDNSYTIVIECCENCRSHQWNTRHDPAKYDQFFLDSKYPFVLITVASAITAKMPNANVIKNQVPKEWVDYDIYCQLLQNEDEANPNYQSIPRTGAFEVSHRGVVSVFFLPLKARVL